MKFDDIKVVGRRKFIKACASASMIPLLNRGFAASLTPSSQVAVGPLEPKVDPNTGLALLRLPKDFHYKSLIWTGDLMSDGTLVPDRPDGMAVFTGEKGAKVLIRNHERGLVAVDSPLGAIQNKTSKVYDTYTGEPKYKALGGGTTSLHLSADNILSSRASLGGTLVNCAGGPTPWNSWLSCEEIILRGKKIGAMDHGYVFEVPSTGEASGIPIKAMGLMRHEATALLPADNSVFLTEDNQPGAGFYRFLPKDKRQKVGALENGGILQQLKVTKQANIRLDQLSEPAVFDVEWVTIANPDADPEYFEKEGADTPAILGAGKSGPYMQGEALGAAQFGRLEGAWCADNVIYFTDTIGGPVDKGTVWKYEPVMDSLKDGFYQRGRLTTVFIAQSEAEADNLDNLTVTPGGALLVCEDGHGRSKANGELLGGNRLIALTPAGDAFPFAENNLVIEKALPKHDLIAIGDYRRQEFTGACFDPSGEWLYVNIQVPGVLLAITGPWQNAKL